MHNILYIPKSHYLELKVLNEYKFNDLLLGMFAQPKKKSFGYGELLLVRSKREIMRVAQKVYLGPSLSDRYLQTLMMARSSHYPSSTSSKIVVTCLKDLL